MLLILVVFCFLFPSISCNIEKYLSLKFMFVCFRKKFKNFTHFMVVYNPWYDLHFDAFAIRYCRQKLLVSHIVRF